MQIQIIIIALCMIAVAICEYAPPFKPLTHGTYTKPPMVYPNWPPIIKPTMKSSYMVQFRGGSRPVPLGVRPPQRFISLNRPVKSAQFLKQPFLKRPYLPPAPSPLLMNFNVKHQFHKSPPGPKTGELIYDQLKPVHQTTIRLTTKDNSPIQTIAAPNLSLSSKNKNPNKLQLSVDNNNHLDVDIYKSTQPTFVSKPQTPIHYHQYQVTEEQTNDITLKDPLSGKQTYFAPDPDPSLPSQKLVPSSDPLSAPSNGKYPPVDVLLQAQSQAQFSHVQYPQPIASSAALVQKPYFDFINAVPSPSYGVPLSTQPQLQQHILQQTSMLQGMPFSVYNPTYLVTQSNNLFNHHQQQLNQANGGVSYFKPENSFIGTVTPPQQLQAQQPTGVVFNSYAYKSPESAASQGQILAATQDQIHELQSAVTQIQLNEVNTHLQTSGSHESPSFAQLTDNSYQQLQQQQQLHQQQQLQQQQQDLHNQEQQHQELKQQEPQQQSLTEGEIANLLNYGTINLHNQNLLQSTSTNNDFYNYEQEQQEIQQQQFYELSKRQKDNEKILAQANEEMLQNHQDQQDYLSAYQQHQKSVFDTLTSNENNGNDVASTHSSLRIFVPDERDYQNAQSRIDSFEDRNETSLIPNNDNYSEENTNFDVYESETTTMSADTESNSKEEQN